MKALIGAFNKGKALVKLRRGSLTALPWSVATDKDHDDAEENHEHVHFLPQLPLRSKRFWLEFVEVCYDFKVDGQQCDEGNNDSEEHSAVGHVVFDVVAVLPEICRPVDGDVIKPCQVEQTEVIIGFH